MNSPLELNWRKNSFNFLRVFLALSVICAHSFELGGFGHDPLFNFSKNIYSVGAIAVDGFFAISGALIAASFLNIKLLGPFLWHRLLRIFPGYWMCILVCAVLIPLLFGVSPDFAYFFHNLLQPSVRMVQSIAGLFLPLLLGWTPDLANLTSKFPVFGQDYLPGVINNNPINGSLWTLSEEFRLYCLIGFLGITNLLKKTPVMILLLLSWLLYATLLIKHPGYDELAKASTYRTTAHFLAGTLLFLWTPPIKHSIAIAVLGLSLLSLKLGIYPLISPIATAYLIFYLACTIKLYKFGREHDFSYGLYVYSFPVQQTLTGLGLNAFGLLVYSLLSVSCSLVFAAFSWHFVEKHALKLKNWQPAFKPKTHS